MATVDSLMPRVLVHAYNAPANFIRQAIIDSAREFCRESRYWREELTAEDTVADQASYTLTVPAESELVDFTDVYFSNKRSLKPKTPQQMNDINYQWRTQTGEPRYYIREGNAGVRLIYIPTEAETGAIQATAALQPTSTATSIDDKLLDTYDEAIIYGALFRVLRVPGKAWSDINMANYYAGMYQAQVDQASSRGTDARKKGIGRKVKYGGL